MRPIKEQTLDVALAEGMIALEEFERTGSRNKFREWSEMYGPLVDCLRCDNDVFLDENE